MEVEAPLDLSVSAASRLKLEYCTDDSDDSDGHGSANADPNCKAYKKSLMKRYRKFSNKCHFL